VIGNLLGGIGVFLIGMFLLTEGLKGAAEDRLRLEGSALPRSGRSPSGRSLTVASHSTGNERSGMGLVPTSGDVRARGEQEFLTIEAKSGTIRRTMSSPF
jgi:hypothetical protein